MSQREIKISVWHMNIFLHQIIRFSACTMHVKKLAHYNRFLITPQPFKLIL